jgi:hypothetical protein
MMNLPDSFSQFLSPEECAQIDQTLLPTRDRFSIRITVYSWRYLQQVSQGLGIPIAHLQSPQITHWLHQDASLHTQNPLDQSFVDWFSHLLTSSLGPLQKIAQQEQIQVEQLTLPQIIHWFEAQVKAAL